jgi:hypothetical protein
LQFARLQDGYASGEHRGGDLVDGLADREIPRGDGGDYPDRCPEQS